MLTYGINNKYNNMKNKKAVIFDLDNTLYEYNLCHEKALNNSYSSLKKYKNISFKKFKSLYES
jgi:FMN phosphatase YigB (HAD superfamily)